MHRNADATITRTQVDHYVGQPERPTLVTLAAIALMAVSWCWATQYPFWPNRESLLDQGKIVGYSWIAFFTFIGGIALWMWALSMLLPRFHGRSFIDARSAVISLSAIVYAAFFLMYPTNAIDVYIYAVRSRLFTKYGANPNAAYPADWWDIDPYVRFASSEWATHVSPYGPLWNLLAAPITAITGDNIGLAIFGFKLLSIASILATGWLIYSSVQSFRPEWALVASLFWLWNPLVLWDGVGNAHNDVILMAPTVGVIWAWTRRRDNMVIPLLVAATLIKYVTIILIPLAIVALWRRTEPVKRQSWILGALGGSLIVATASLFPYYDLKALATSARVQSTFSSASPAWWFQATIARTGLAHPTMETIQIVATTIAGLAIAGWAWRLWTKRTDFIRACFEAMFVFMFFASTNQRGWYVIWLVPLAAMVIPANGWRRALVWSVSSLAGHASSIWLWYVWDWDHWDTYWYWSIMFAVVYAPVLVAIVWEATLARCKDQEKRSEDRTIM